MIQIKHGNTFNEEEKFVVKVDGEVKKGDDGEKYVFNSKDAAQAYIDKHDFKNAEIVKESIQEDEKNTDEAEDVCPKCGKNPCKCKKKESCSEIITVVEEFKLPGTDVVLEKGDRIRVVNEGYDKTAFDAFVAEHPNQVIFEDSNFKFYRYNSVGMRDTFFMRYEVSTKSNSLADKHAIEIRIQSKSGRYDGTPEINQPKSLYIGVGMPDEQVSILEKIRTLQDTIKFAEKVADYLKIRIENK